MKHVKLSDGLIDTLIEEMSERIKDGLAHPKSTLPRELVKTYRAMTAEEIEASSMPATDADVELLEKLLDADEIDEATPTEGSSASLTLTLTPRLSMALRWQAEIYGRTPEQEAGIILAESLKSVTGDLFACEETAVSWLKEGSPAEGVLEAYLEEHARSREEVAS